MPIYEAICRVCDKQYEYFVKVTESNNTPSCCGKATEKAILTAPLGVVDNPAFMSKYKHLYNMGGR